ncbi:MAG: DUF4097 family beta strand repeat-containing protein [Planctomycetota bacterium]
MNGLATRTTAILIATTFAGLCALSGCVSVGDPRYEERLSITERHRSGGIAVETDNGSVRIQRGGQDRVEITAVVRAQTASRAERVGISTRRDRDGYLHIEALWPEGRRLERESCAFDIVVPDAEGVRVRSSNGAVKIDGLSGLADIQTSNGPISVLDHDGPLDADTSNGAVQFETYGSPAKVRTTNGRVELTSVGAPLEIDTSNGSVVVRLDRDARGPVEIESSSGSILFEVGEAFGGSVEARTDNGRITVERLGRRPDLLMQSKRHVLIQLDEGRDESSLRTGNGSIRIRTADGRMTSERDHRSR